MEGGFFEMETAIWLGLMALICFSSVALFEKSKQELSIKHKDFKNEWNND